MKSVELVIVLLFLFCYLHFCSTFWLLAVDQVKFCSICFFKTHLAHCLSYFYAASLLQAMSRSTNISHQMEYLLATGNLVSRSGLGLMQVCCLPLVFPIYFTLFSFYSLLVFMSVKQPPTSTSFPHFLFMVFFQVFLRQPLFDREFIIEYFCTGLMVFFWSTWLFLKQRLPYSVFTLSLQDLLL